MENYIEKCEEFLADFDRHVWMLENGVWVGEDEDAYIAEGIIDPDDVYDDAQELEGGPAPVQVWNGQEYWRAYRHGAALYINWVRVAYGERHARDLWIEVDPAFFAE